MTASPLSLAEFLEQRIAEDEQAARAASPAPWNYGDVASVAGGTLYDYTRRIADVCYEQPGDHDGTIVRHLLVPEADANGAHIARFDPARVLAECEAKRRIVEAMALPDNLIEADAQRVADIARRLVLGNLASVYADHPDYREEWRP